MSSQLSAHAITAHTAITRISVSRCSTLPAHRGSARAEKCSTRFSADIAILPSSIKGEPAQPVSPSEPARPFHALPLGLKAALARGRKGGRRRKLSTADEAVARAMLADPTIPVAAIAKRLGGSRTTFYGYFPAARTRAQALHTKQ